MSNAHEEDAQENARELPSAQDAERRVAAVLETSRQTVKDKVKRELETESVSSDLLNLRLHT